MKILNGLIQAFIILKCLHDACERPSPFSFIMVFFFNIIYLITFYVPTDYVILSDYIV